MSQQSRMQRYQNGVKKFLSSRSVYQKMIENNVFFEYMIKKTNNLASTAMLTILKNASNKINYKGCHGYFLASGLDVLIMFVNILENEKYYNAKFGKDNVSKFIEITPFKIFSCLSENMKTLENSVPSTELKLKLQKVFYYSINYIQEKIIYIIKKNIFVGESNVKKLDIINFKFNDVDILKNKYSKLKKINEKDFFSYVEDKYCNITKIAFVVGWLLGLGEEKYVANLEQLGTNFGYMIKISNDFVNLEKDINNSKDITYNMIANYGIHYCFNIFFENKTKLIKGCMELDIYSHTMKEIIDFIEKCFDECLNNTDLDLASTYSSFTKRTDNNENNNTTESDENSENDK